MGGLWPQLTPWGRFFKLSGYTAGRSVFNQKEGIHLPVGVLGQAGATWAADSKNLQGETVIPDSGVPEPYLFGAEVGTKLTNFLGVFYEYEVFNTFQGWKGVTGPADIRAVHFFHVNGTEILAGIDVNNNPTIQDVWNSVPSWGYPFYVSPQSVGARTSPLITKLGSEAAGVGGYALINRHLYVEGSAYRVGNNFFRWLTGGTNFTFGGLEYLNGYNPYWRAYWQDEKGPHSWMLGTFGLHANVFPNSATPRGAVDTFTDYGVDTQYQYLANTHKVAVRGTYTYEKRDWKGSLPLGFVGTPKGNLETLNVNTTYTYKNSWAFSAGLIETNGNRDPVMYGVFSPSGALLSDSPKTTGYTLEVDRHITQNIQLNAQYRGLGRLNGLRHNVDGSGRDATDNNTAWVSIFFAF